MTTASDWDPDRDGPGVIRLLDPLARAIEAASFEDVSLLIVGLSRLEQCPACEGSGRMPIGEHFISREMALDACEPAMEGMSMGIEYGPCEECSGGGLKEEPTDGRS